MYALRIAICTLILGLSAGASAGDFQTRVFGGKDAPASEWPWMVAVLNDAVDDNFHAQFCGGMRISDRWILSAAHCFQPKDENKTGFNESDIAVLLDTVELCDDCTSGRLAIDRIIIHRDWDDDTGPADEDDIALLRLTDPDNASSSVTASVIDQPRSNALPDSGNDGVEVLGWGATAPNTDDSTEDEYWFPTTLQQVALDFLPLSECKDQYGDDSLFSESMICAYEPNADDFEDDDEGDTSPDDPNVDGDTAGEDTFGEDTCVGDSGGPLFVEEADADWVAGITSWGYECGDASRPGVYTEIQDYVGWLEKQTSTDGPPLVDVFAGFGKSVQYQAPGTTVTVQASLGNQAVNNDANNALAVLGYTASASATDADGNDGLSCTTGSTSNTLECRAGDPLSAGNSGTGPVDITHANSGNELLAITLTAQADEDDYRRDNDQARQKLIFSSEPDMSLSFGEPDAGAEAASVPLTVHNKATHETATSISFELNLPAGITLENPGELNCNGNPWVCRPGDDLGVSGSIDYTLKLSADATGSYELSAAADSDSGDFPDDTPDDTTSVVFSTEDSGSSSSSSGSSSAESAERLLLLLLAGGGLQARAESVGALSAFWWVLLPLLYSRRKKRSMS